MVRRHRSDEERASVDELVADLHHLITETGLTLPSDASPEDRELAAGARLDVIRATNAVSTAALGSDSRSIILARRAVDGAMSAVLMARAAIRRHRS